MWIRFSCDVFVAVSCRGILNSLLFTKAWSMKAWIPVVSSSLYFWKSVFSFRVDSILKWRVYIKLKVSWLRAFLWCMSQTSRDRVNSRRVRTHEKNSGDAVRRLGTIMQSIFCAQSGANIRSTVLKRSCESRYPGAFSPVLEHFPRAFSPARLTAPGSPRINSLGPTRGSRTARARRARRDYKLTSLGASRGTNSDVLE